ncbi:MAG TPA: TIGR03936 family radical SAM-associated protein [Verrucomicrobiae bacterium]|nr:TIGR03936 family radical SAM-associated protein [Verrucomicrobiae bacterium]
MKIEKEFLPFVIRPGRYTDGELGSFKKEGQKIRAVLLYPDLYEFAISSFEHRQAYAVLNNHPDIAVERAYLPAPDAQKVMKEEGVPLFTVESGRPVKEFDLILFQTERKRDHFFFPRLMELAGLEAEREKRGGGAVVATFGKGSLWSGGLGRFFDTAVHLEGFAAAVALSRSLSNLNEKFDRQRFLENLEGATIYATNQSKKGHPAITPSEYRNYFPKLLIPTLDPESSFLNIRLDGLTGDLDVTAAAVDLQNLVFASGYDDVRFDFAGGEPPLPLAPLAASLAGYMSKVYGKLDFSNLKPELFTPELLAVLRKSSVLGAGFYLGSGVERNRKLLGVQAGEGEIFEKVREVLNLAPKQIRLYLYLGFPNETEEEIAETAEFLNRVASEVRRGSGRTMLRGYLGVFSAVPHQGLWKGALIGPSEVTRRQELLKKHLSARNLQLRYEPPEQIYLTGLWERLGDKVADFIAGYAAHIKPDETPDDGADYRRLDWVLQEMGVRATEVLGAEFLGTEPRSGGSGLPTDWAYRVPVVKKSGAPITLSLEPPTTAASASGGEMQYGRAKRRIRFHPEALQVPNTVIRFRWEKGEAARYSSHLDVIKVFERALRRSGLPVSYSQGFHPKMKVAFGPALPLGHLSTAEYLDIRFEQPYRQEFFARLAAALPPGFSLIDAQPILAKTESLSASVNVARYEVRLPGAVESTRCAKFLEEKEVWVERSSEGERKRVNVRPFVRGLEPNGHGLKMELVMAGGDYARPEEVLVGMGLPEMVTQEAVFIRRELLIFADGNLLSPHEVR